MLDTPPNTLGQQGGSTDASVPASGKVYWPSPPLASYPGSTELEAPVACMIQTSHGRMGRGHLVSFNSETLTAEVRFTGDKPPVRMRFDQFLSLTLTQPLAPAQRPSGASRETAALFEDRPRTPYKLVLKDGREMSGQTIGHLDKPAGLFLFPPVDEDDRVIRMFLPRQALQRQEIGAPIGALLVEQQAASSEQVELAAAMQESLRAQKLGQLLVQRHIVTAEELLKALQVQARMPVMRVGEALMALGLIRQEQLDEVLAIQKTDRSLPLGELLVRQNMISRQDLCMALARKMGYPIVDLAQFSIEAGALQRVPYAMAQRLRVLPLVLNDAMLVVGMEDVTRRKVLDEIEFATQLKVVPALVSQEDIDRMLGPAYARVGQGAADALPAAAADGGVDKDASDVSKLAENLERDGIEEAAQTEEKPIEQSDNSLVRLINQMIVEAANEGVSDIHIECSPGKDKVKVRFRKDGRLRPYLELPHTYRNAVVSRIKVMCDLDISERRKPQDGKINFARFWPQLKLELRVVTIPTTQGLEDIVMRLLASAKPIPLPDLGLSPGNLARLTSIIERPYGLVLCVGPTGSGKTTTLHSALGYINKPERKIWTAEDPVEITQAGLRQVQVNPKIGWTFAAAMRSFMRADPDIIMVGEMRDAETARIGIEASLTGHLVLSTLHTNSAAESVVRLLDLGMDPFNFADALLGVLSQRLVRRLCARCAAGYAASDAELEDLAREYCLDAPEDPRRLVGRWREQYRGPGGDLMLRGAQDCEQCNGSG